VTFLGPDELKLLTGKAQKAKQPVFLFRYSGLVP
jgi:hypothetical protein